MEYFALRMPLFPIALWQWKYKSVLHLVVLKHTKEYALIGICCLLGEIIMGICNYYCRLAVLES